MLVVNSVAAAIIAYMHNQVPEEVGAVMWVEKFSIRRRWMCIFSKSIPQFVVGFFCSGDFLCVRVFFIHSACSFSLLFPSRALWHISLHWNRTNRERACQLEWERTMWMKEKLRDKRKMCLSFVFTSTRDNVGAMKRSIRSRTIHIVWFNWKKEWKQKKKKKKKQPIHTFVVGYEIDVCRLFHLSSPFVQKPFLCGDSFDRTVHVR